MTDLHLLSVEGTRVLDFANKRWAGGLNILVNRGRHYLPEVFDALVDDLNRQGIEQVICSGDVTNLSLESEFRFARARFERLAVGPKNVLCVPGNHDTYIAEAKGAFERNFEPYCTADDDWRWPGGERWPVVRVRGDAALIGLSTSEASGWLMGYGTLGEEQLERLESVLADARLADKLRVIVLHHPPAGRHARSARRGLKDREAFAKVVERAGAELILHGHEHLDLRESLLGAGGKRVPVLGVQSSTYCVSSPKRQARYRVFHLQAGSPRPRLAQIELRRWQQSTGFALEEALAA